MKWADFNLKWGRPLKSILAIFDNEILEFNYHHLKSSNSTFIDKEFEEKRKLLRILNLIKIILRKQELLLIKI